MGVKRILILGLLLSQNFVSNGQDYPTDYFRNPLDIPMFLAGNFGECRPNHFHSGIDIKTEGRENFKVYAAADGYISRIKMEPGGFGHALYITHPNGYTTLYAHLNDFVPNVQEYVVAQQYENESWELDIPLDSNKFPVKKGQQIAWSGNTGGSTAPHLHFEIRSSSTEHPLNPLLFGMPITDNIAPKPTQITTYDLSKSLYEQTPQTVTLRKKGDDYVADTIKVNTTLAGIGVNVYDYMNGSVNTLNFYTAEMYMDDELQTRIKLDDIGYDVTRYLHAYIDYKTRKTKGSWIQCLFELPGNRLDHIYEQLNADKGALNIGDGQAHKINIVLTDAFSNVSNIRFYVVASGDVETLSCVGDDFAVNQPNNYAHPNVILKLDEKALYDRVCLQVSSSTDANSFSDKYTIGQDYIPMHTYNELKIKPNKAVGFDKRNKMVLVYKSGNDETGRAATLEDGWYKAYIRAFGTYYLRADTEPPVVKSLQAAGANLGHATRISFRATDNMTSVKKFRAELDGKWIKFEQRGNLYFYTFDEHCAKGPHKLVVTATDENNNKTTLPYNFKR